MNSTTDKRVDEETHADTAGADQATQSASGYDERADNDQPEHSQRPWLRRAGGARYLIDGIVW